VVLQERPFQSAALNIFCSLANCLERIQQLIERIVMKRVVRLSLILSLLIVPIWTGLAQQVASISNLEEEIKTLEAVERYDTSSDEVKQLNHQFLVTRRSQLRALLRRRIDSLRKYQSGTGAVLKSDENDAINKAIGGLEQKLSALEQEMLPGEPGRRPSSVRSVKVADVNVTSSVPMVATAFAVESDAEGENVAAGGPASRTQGTPLVLGLSHPASGRPALPTGEFKLSWALRPIGSHPQGIKYTVEISESNAFNPATDTIHADVTDDTFFDVPKEALRPGKRYFWQVTATCPPAIQCPNGMLTAVNAPFDFTTELDPFRRLEDKGFTLQRSVAGDDATEGASLSFLRTFRQKNVYATDFALIWDKPNPANLGGGRTQIFPELSVEGHLASDRSASEDVWRFGVSAGLFTSFNRGSVDENNRPRFGRLKGLTSYLGGKFEAHRDIDTKKVYFEALETPTLVSVYMGQYSGSPDSPAQFRWRPYFAFQVGHTMKRGASALPEDTILRLVPRVRAELKLNFISRPLGFKRTLLFADNTFFYLPLENTAKTPNFLVSGLEFDLSSDIGLAFTYKNGKTAPKFERVHTLGAAFTIRFGKKNDN
jgi:hypothetical protein